jgi:hypothetical protein
LHLLSSPQIVLSPIHPMLLQTLQSRRSFWSSQFGDDCIHLPPYANLSQLGPGHHFVADPFRGHGCGRIELDSRQDHVLCTIISIEKRRPRYVLDRDHGGGTAANRLRTCRVRLFYNPYATLLQVGLAFRKVTNKFLWSSRVELLDPLATVTTSSTSLAHARIMNKRISNVIRPEFPGSANNTGLWLCLSSDGWLMQQIRFTLSI